MAEMEMNLKCSSCGSDQFEYPEEAKADDTVKCTGCGATARYGDLQAQAEEEAMKLVTSALDKSFGDLARKHPPGNRSGVSITYKKG